MKLVGNIWRKHSLYVMFLFVIIVVGILNIPNLCDAVGSQNSLPGTDTGSIEDNYQNNFWRHSDFVDIQGEIAKFSGQKINNGVVKDEDGSLYLMDEVDYTFDEQTETKNCDDTKAIMDAAEDAGAAVLYVQRIYKTGNLPYGLTFQRDRQYDFWRETMSSSGFPVLDIKETLGEDKLLFYKTDHHWTVETAFETAKCTVERLSEEYGLELDSSILDSDKYESRNWENSFLGSSGIRTGKYFSGKDDFAMPFPAFDTDLTYEHLIDGTITVQKRGDFEEALVDTDILDDPEYNNKYNACLNGGYVENIIVNHQNEEGLNALVISDSYARPMVQYLSLCFRETRYLDPQEGRYNSSYVEYIKEYEPDIVIVMYSSGYVRV